MSATAGIAAPGCGYSRGTIMPPVKIGRNTIGVGQPCYIICEIGNNHGGDPELAKQMIEAAASADVNAVKFQTFKGKDIVSPQVKATDYPGWDVAQKFELWIDFLDSIALPLDAIPSLIQLAHKLNVDFISTPLSTEAADFLVEVGVDALKIASMDLTNLPLLQHVKDFGLPVIMSTGMANLGEIEEAIETLGEVPLVLLHCVSEYPLKLEHAHLRHIQILSEVFDIPIGFSDHSMGFDLDIAAVALGACAIEKHFTLNRNSPFKAEHHFSLEPHELKELVRAVRDTEAALGPKSSAFVSADRNLATAYRRSLQLTRDLGAGELIKAEDLISLRPGTGILPKYRDIVIKRRTARSCRAYIPLQWEDLA